MDLVSIIIPYYKKKDFISGAINSAINQTYKNIEILIIYDDENFDDMNFLINLQKNNKKIYIIKNTKRMGAGFSRNIGISKSKGNYIAFLDADDTWKLNKLTNQINFMKQNNCDVSHTTYSIVDKNNNIIGKRIARNFFKIDDLLKSCDIGTSTVIVKKKLITNEIKFASLKTKEDFVLWLKLLRENVKIYGLDEDLTLWTKSKLSLSSSTFQKLIDGFKVYYKYMNFSFIKSSYYLLCLSFNYLLKK